MRSIFAAAVLVAIATPAHAQTVVVTADRMVDVLAGKVIDEPVVVITDGRIASVVGRGGARPVIPEGATRIDLPGKTILPGLIDMHVHLDSSSVAMMSTAPPIAAARALIHRSARPLRHP